MAGGCESQRAAGGRSHRCGLLAPESTLAATRPEPRPSLTGRHAGQALTGRECERVSNPLVLTAICSLAEATTAGTTRVAAIGSHGDESFPAGRPGPRPLWLARPVMRAQREVGWHRQAALPVRNVSDLVAAGRLQLAPCGSTRTGDYMEIRATP